jgi:hypothetical protein
MKSSALFPSLFLIIFACTFNSKAQQVSGRVTSFKNIPLQNVMVKSLKSGNTAITDSAGMFSLETAPGDALLFSASGFFDRKIRTSGMKVIDADLRYKFDKGSFDQAVKGHHISAPALSEALRAFPAKGQKDYSKYQSIFDLIRAEINNVRVSGTNVFSAKAISFSMSAQVLYVVNDMVVNDISYISPTEVAEIVYLEGNAASDYGIRGANGVIKITTKTR